MKVYSKIIILLICCLAVSITATAQQKRYKKTIKKRKGTHKVTSHNVHYKPVQPVILYNVTDTTVGDSLYSFAKGHLGIRYRYGGADPRGFDCSGFVLYCFKHFGYKLPHEAGQQMKISVQQTEKTAQKGDIIYFGYYNRKTKNYYISHSGIVASTDGGKIWFIHSASNVGIRLDCLDQAWYRQRFVGIGRVIQPTNIVIPKPENGEVVPSN